jgi:hypothetical protein
MEKEFLVVVHVINKLRYHINGYEVFIDTDHYIIRYLMKKPTTNGRVTIWLFLFHEFNITILDRPGKENLVAFFLSRIHNEDQETLVYYDFPNDHLFVVCTNSPWFKYVANNLVTGKFPQHLSPSEKNRIAKLSSPYSWIGWDLF